MTRPTLLICSLAILATLSGNGNAQSTIGEGSRVVIPVAAQTKSFSTEVFLMNASGATSVTVGVTYVGATGSATPGELACGQITLPASGTPIGATASFTLAGQCVLAPGSNFGMILLIDTATPSVNGFFAYSRTQNPQAIGFSIEGFPAGSIAAQSQRIIGLKRVASPIPFQTNCFIGSFDKPVSYRVQLFDSSGAVLLGVVTGSLLPFQMIRYLDIFAAVGAAPGDYVDYTARIQNTNLLIAGNNDLPIFVSFCTVQDNVSFGADFRVGKVFDAFDNSYDRDNAGCTPTTTGCSSYDYAVTDLTLKDVFAFYVRPPDTIQCSLLSGDLADLQMQLRQPDFVPSPLSYYPPGSAAIVRTPGPIVAGGTGENSFDYQTGTDVVRVSDGALLRDFWSLEVSASAAATTVPIPYSISCLSGNGTMYARPYTAAKDF